MQAQSGAKDFVTIPEAARELGISVKLLRRAARSGGFRTYPINSWPRCRIVEVRQWILGMGVLRNDAKARVAEVEERRQRAAP